MENKQKASEFMVRNFNAELFLCNPRSILKKTAILDTLILGISKQGNDNFLKARVFTNCSEKYFAKLRCNANIVEKFNKTKSNRALLAVKVERTDNIDISASADSLDGKINEFVLDKAILLTGECLALHEISLTLN